MSKGDFVRVLVDTGRDVQEFRIVASGDGRSVEVVDGPRVVKVEERSKGGAVVRTARFMSSRIVAMDEQKGQEELRLAARLERHTAGAAAAQAGAPTHTQPDLLRESPADPEKEHADAD